MKRLYLNVGCGEKKIPGFINIDLEPVGDLQVDIREGLPFADNSLFGIYSEHFIEHLTQGEGVSFFRECRRVLVPDGKVRFATPDLDAVIKDYVNNKHHSDWEKHGIDWLANRCEMLNLSMRLWGHQWLYNEEELIRLAEMAGLTLVKRYSRGESDEPRFRNRETREASRLIVEFAKHRPGIRGSGANTLVSVLIPAYNSRYFREALESVLRQTYSNLEIIICDDSSGDEIRQLAAAAADSDARVRYEKNQERLLGYGNNQKCFDQAGGDYIKFLNDDDLLHPQCIERMVRCLDRYPDVTLVTSHRQCIDARGDPLPDMIPTQRPVGDDSIVDGISVACRVLATKVNFIGEPTTVMFRKKDLEGVRPTIMSLGGCPIRMACDVAMWLNLLSRGDMIYLVASLSYFRQHPAQRQRDPDAQAAGERAWQQMRLHGERLGLWSRGPAELRARPLEVRAQWPEEILEHLHQADSHLAAGDLDATREALITASTLAPDDPWLIVTLGNVLMQSGDLDGARREYTKATVLHPEYHPAYFSLGLAALELERLEEAEGALRRAVVLYPDGLDGWRMLGRIYLAQGRYEEGLEVFGSILEQRPQDLECLLIMADCYAAAGRRDEARAMYEQVLQLEPGDSTARRGLEGLDRQPAPQEASPAADQPEVRPGETAG